MTKQEYNRRYYEKNKHRWSGDKKSELSLGNVFHLFGKTPFHANFTNDPLTDWIPFLKRLQVRLLIGCVVIATVLLVYESAKFYLEENDSTMFAFTKAILFEGFAILLSFSKCHNFFLRWIRNFLVIFLCTFTVLVMSGKGIKTASSETVKAEMLRESVKRLNSELEQKVQLRQAFYEKHMLTTARRYEKGIDHVRAELRKVEDEIRTEQAPKVISHNLKILVLCRVLLAIANLASIHMIMEYFRPDAPLLEVKRASRAVEFS